MSAKPAADPIFAARDQGAAAFALIEELYPICRSITGPGVTATLDIIERFVPLKRTQVPTGTKVFDWEVPREWTIRDAFIKNATPCPYAQR